MTLASVLEIVLTVLLGFVSKFLISYFAAKSEEAKAKTDSEIAKKYIDMITKTVTDCVIATNQTYVDVLKVKGEFTKEAQIEAFNKTKGAILTILSDDVLEYLNELTGDVEQYLTTLIESEVAKEKQDKGSN